MYVAELARKVGVSADTVRYYSKIGMLRPSKNPDNGYQVYTTADAGRLRFIRAARGLGYTLADVRAILDDAERGDSPCPRVRALIELHIAETEAQIRELSELRDKMRTAVGAWREMPDSQPTGDSVCALIEALGT